MQGAEFYANSPNWVKFEQNEVDALISPKTFSILERPDYIEIKRIVTTTEIKKYLSDADSYREEHFVDLKVAFIETDAIFLSSLGYGEIEMLDIAPGDTIVSYLLRAKRK